jgi:predicted GIY-YIG superfamily endonuclease
MERQMFWIYMLKCVDGSYYIGHSDNLSTRIAQHHAGTIPTCYTFSRRPVDVVYSREFPTREEAIAMERKLKGWSRAKKAALIRNDWVEISRLSRARNENQNPSTSSGRTEQT